MFYGFDTMEMTTDKHESGIDNMDDDIPFCAQITVEYLKKAHRGDRGSAGGRGSGSRKTFCRYSPCLSC